MNDAEINYFLRYSIAGHLSIIAVKPAASAFATDSASITPS
jgi:hypothetical protein